MRIAIDTLPGRYTPTIINGNVQHVRDKVALQADVVALLRESGPLPKKKIITALHTVQWLVDEVMEKALADGEIERFQMRSSRGRMDEYWCAAGAAPQEAVTFNGRLTLIAMQAHAATIAKGGWIENL